MGSAAMRSLADKGYRVAALTTGWDQQENDLVRFPFDVSPYEGTGQVGLNILNAVFDPSTSVFEGNPSGPGESWNFTGVVRGQGVGGGGNHNLLDAVWPFDQDLDGPLPTQFIGSGDVRRMSIGQAGTTAKWGTTRIKDIIRNRVETFEAAAYLSAPPLTESISQRGTSGPLRVSQLDGAPSGDQLLMINAMSYAQTQLNPVFNTGPVPVVEDTNIEQNANGVSQLQYMLHFDPLSGKFVRQNSATAFLNRNDFSLTPGEDLVGRRLKAYVKTNAYVTKLLTKKQNGALTFSGVLATVGGEVVFVRAKNIVLAAGSSMTPRLLEVSGIGSSQILAKFNIEPKLVLPSVGEHLHNQNGSSLIFSTTDPDFSVNFYGQAFMGYNGTDRVFQFIQIGLGSQNYGFFTGGVPYADPSLNYAVMSCFMTHPRSYGSIHIASDNLQDHPDLKWQWFSDGSDPNDPSSGLTDIDSDIYKACISLDYQYQVIKRLQTTYPAGNLQIAYPPLSVFLIANQTQRFAAYVPYVLQLRSSSAHEGGSCNMNNDPNLGVVNEDCQIHGISNGFITDFSIMPCQVSGNPSMFLMAAGLNAGDLIANVVGK